MRNLLQPILLAGVFASLCSGDSIAESAQTLLTAKCQTCHNDQAKAGGLSLTNIENIRKGGKRGPAIIAGNPAESLLFRLISGAQPAMPFGGQSLDAAQIDTIRQWIDQGAEWPQPSKWWSLRPLHRPAIPGPSDNWIKTPIDAFVLAKLREKGLSPSLEADRRTLIRRLTYDLHGLPPSAEEVEAFIADRSPHAYENLVDRLLASPRYGERWGRHWLDVVHYGESHGYDKDKPRRNAWPYRDYVIRAFNEDKPYTRFVEEQLAGDVFSPDDPNATVALGFLAAGPWDFVGQAELAEGTTDKKITRLLDRDDIVTQTMSALVSTTAHCARCHDHKFDPIRQSEYYALQSVFAGIDRADRPFDSDPAVLRARNQLLARKRAIAAALRPLEEQEAATTSPEIAALDKQVAEDKQVDATDPARRPQEIQKKIAAAAVQRKAMVRAALVPATRAELDRLRSEMADLDRDIKGLPKPQLVYAAANYFEPQGTFRFAIDPRPVNMLMRGSVDSPGAVASPGALSLVDGLSPVFRSGLTAPEGERRADLARWIVDSGNMLAWRSIVNRIWHYHFGTGIVDSLNDFGHMGSLPTHPELLDWLAVEFRDSGGSFKKLHKLIVMSATYRQASAGNAAGESIDSENRYLWRANRQRLDAESLRDSILAASGKLDLAMGGPSVEQFFFKDDHSPVYDYSRYDPDAPGNYRRSVYRFLVRSMPDPLMERFDCPDVSMITAKRTTTITAIQALALLNNPFVLKQAEHLAVRVKEAGGDPVEAALRITLQRLPNQKEQQTLTAYLAREGMVNFCRLLLNLNEFLFVD